MAEKLYKKALRKLGLYDAAARLYSKAQASKRRKAYEEMKATGEAPMPSRILFEPTQRCNLRCKMCFFNRDMTVKPQEMTNEQIKKVFDGLGTAKFVNLIGGEILVRPDIFDIMDYLKSKGMEIQIGTNGTMITEENAGKFNDSITAATFSIDGGKELHNSIRGTDFAFDNTVRGIALIKDRIPVYVVAVIQDDNIDHLPEIVKLVADMGVKNLTFEFERKYTPDELDESARLMGMSKDNFHLSVCESGKRSYGVDTLRQKLDEAVAKGKELGVKVGFYPSFLRDEVENCYNGTLRENGKYICKYLFTGRIDPQGNLIHCYAIRKAFGNLLDKPLAEIWNSEEMKEFRKRLLGNNLLPLCETCLHKEKVE